MRNYVSIIGCCVMVLSAYGQAPDKLLAEQEAACFQRFAVNDCLRKVRAHQRAERDAQRRLEVEKNDAERKEKAKDRLDRLSEKSVNPN